MMLFGFGRVPGCLGLGALFLWDEWRDERTDCQRGGCMVVPGAVDILLWRWLGRSFRRVILSV